MATIGTITVSGYRFYNGGWSSSYSSIRASYSGKGRYCTVDKIVLPSFTSSKYSNFTISINISMIRIPGYTTSGTLYGYLCTNDPASGSPTQTPHISFIGSGQVDYSGLNNNHKYVNLSVTTSHSLSSGGTYYLWLQSSNPSTLHYDAKVTMTLYGTVTQRTLTMKGDSGVASGLGSYTGDAWSNKDITVTAKTNYRLKQYYGTTADGTSNNTWTGCDGLSSHTDTWTLGANRTITVSTYPPRTLTMKAGNSGNSGIASGLGTFTTYHKGSLTISTVAATGYLLDHYYGTTYDGSGNDTWTGCKGKSSYSSDWDMYASRTVYVYTTPKTYTVTFNANGGTGSMRPQTATYNAAFRTAKCGFTRTNYEFIGYNEKADGSGTPWSLGSTGMYESGKDWIWTYDSNITLYAQWKKLDKERYQIRYYANYPNTTSQTVFGTTFHEGGKSAVMINSVPTRVDYVFKGWSKSATATVPSYFSNSSTNITAATSLYAVWWPKFTWMNYNYTEWVRMVQNCSKYIEISIKVPDPRYYSIEYNTIVAALKKHYIKSIPTISAGTLIKKIHCTNLSTAWNAINSGYAYGDSSSM